MNFKWENILVKDIALVKGGKRLPKGTTLQSSKNNHPYIRTRDIKDHKLQVNGMEYVPEEIFPSIRNYTVEEGDLIISIVGTIGNCALIPKKLHKASLTENCAKLLNLNNEKMHIPYLFYFFNSYMGQRLIKEQTVGSTQPKLPIYGIENISLPLPTIQDQKAIAHILGILDEKIEINKNSIKTLEEIAKTIFKSWFIDFDPVKAKEKGLSEELPNEIRDLFPDSFKDSKLGKIPIGWSCSSFGKFLVQKKEKIGDRSATVLSAINSGELVPSEKYFLKKVFSKNISKYIAIHKYDIAYNPSRVNIGSIGMHNHNYLGAVSPIYIVLRPSPGWHWFSEMSIKRSYFNQNVQVLASGSVRQTLSVDDFLGITVVTPPLESPLLSYFNNFFDLLLKRQNTLNEEIKYLQVISNALLPRFISGELRIPDAEKMIEEVGI